MLDVRAVRGRLAGLIQPDNGWGYQPAQPMHIEPTCMAVLALSPEPTAYDNEIRRGLQAIEENRRPDASYRLTRGRPQAVWATALVYLARRALGHNPQTLAATADFLLNVKGRTIKADPEAADTKDQDIDVGLVGWPWAVENFSWVEPTSWACVALRAAGYATHPRVREGMKLLLDRAFDTGGVNTGNRIVLGKPTMPVPSNTAQMLLALQGVKDEPLIDAAKGYLRVVAAQSTDAENLAWAILALSVHAEDSATRDLLPIIEVRLHEALAAELDRKDGLGAGPYRLALAASALNYREGHPFRLPEDGASPSTSEANASNDDDTPPDDRTFGERLKSRVRGWFVSRVHGQLRPLPALSAVHIARASSYDEPLAEILAGQFEHFRATVPLKGKRVVLKPNLVEFHRDKVINTDIRVVDAVIELCKREGAAEITVAEAPGHWRNVQFLVKESGLAAVLEKHGVRFVDLNHDEPVKMLNLGRMTGLDYLYLARTVVEAEVLISLPRLKTHHWAGVTLSLKNLFGTLPGICYGWPKNELHWRGIPNSVVDIACTNCPHLAIVDGIVGMEGDGPINGTAKPCGVLVMGADLLAVDATCSRIMQIPPERVPTLAMAMHKRLGLLKESMIPQLGEAIANVAVPFELPPKIERFLLSAEQAAKLCVA